MMLMMIPILDLKKQILLDFRLNFVTKKDKVITLIPLVACLILETLLSGSASSLPLSLRLTVQAWITHYAYNLPPPLSLCLKLMTLVMAQALGREERQCNGESAFTNQSHRKKVYYSTWRVKSSFMNLVMKLLGMTKVMPSWKVLHSQIL